MIAPRHLTARRLASDFIRLLRDIRLWPLIWPLIWPLLAAAAPLDDARKLVDASEAQVRIDPERSRDLAERALTQLARLPAGGEGTAGAQADLRMRAQLLLCDYHSERDLAAAERDIAAATTLLPQIKREGLRASLLSCQGALREGAGDTAEAIALYSQAVSVAETAHDLAILADTLYLRGYLRGVRGDFSSGLADLKRAHHIAEEQRLSEHALSIQNAIASLYSRLGDHAQSRHYYEAALKAQTASGLVREQAVTRNNLGRALENMLDLDAAQQMYETARIQSRQIAYVRSEAYALRGLASVANARGKPEAALPLIDQAAQLRHVIPDERLNAQLLIQRGVALRLLLRLQESADALEAARAIFFRADALAELARAHRELAVTRAELGDWKAAYQSQFEFKRVSDQLLAQQLDERFATLRIEYDSAAKDQEMRLLQREQSATAYALSQARAATQARGIAIALGAVLLALLAAFAWRQRRNSKAMQQLAMTDALTGLPNRRDVLGRLAAQLQAAEPACARLIIDIDHFKRVNDQHGHHAGDEVLRSVAAALRESCRDPISVGRFGGEEFLVLLPETRLDAALTVAERLRARIAQLDVSRWAPSAPVTISIGLAVAGPGDDSASLLRRADAALYDAKDAGRNQVVARGAKAVRTERVST